LFVWHIRRQSRVEPGTWSLAASAPEVSQRVGISLRAHQHCEVSILSRPGCRDLGRIGSTMVRLTAIRLEIGHAAIISGCRRASTSSAEGPQTFHTNLIRSASSASTHSEDINNQAAFCRPINCGNRYDDAASGARRW
jgi:hypothetical protein